MSLTPAANGKIFNQKTFYEFFWAPFGSRVSIKIKTNFSSSFYVVSSLIIVPIVCHRCCLHRWQIATSVVDNSGKFAASIVDSGGKFATGINSASETGGKICPWCRIRGKFATGVWYRWCTFTCEYLREFSKKFETVLMEYSGAGGKLIHEKKPEAKNLVTLSL